MDSFLNILSEATPDLRDSLFRGGTDSFAGYFWSPSQEFRLESNC